MASQEEKPPVETNRVDDATEKVPGLHGKEDLDDAQRATQAEHETTLKQALRENYMAIIWSAIVSLTIVMEGYDLNLMQNFFGYPSFTAKFGTYDPGSDSNQLTGAWQAGLVQGTNAGVIIGGFMNGWFSSRYGYRRTLMAALVCQTGFIFISFFAVSIEMLLVGQMLCGLTWGVYATTGPAYASEVCPLALRGYLTVYVNLCWAMGQFISSGIIQGLVSNETQWGWRIPIAVQWVWPVPIVIAIIFAPESPWWLVRKDRFDEALHVLCRLTTRSEEHCRASLSQIQHTTRLEDEMNHGVSYLDCFKGVNLRRTEICIMVFVGAQLSGSNFAYSPSYFLLQAGLGVQDAYNFGLGGTALAFVGTMLSWILLTYFGRRAIFLAGMLGDAIVLFVVAISSAAAPNAQDSLWVQVSFMMLWQAIYSLSVGPIGYAIVSETSAVQLRPQTVVLARNSYNVVYIICGILNPYMINPTEWNLQGKTAFVWASTASLMVVWIFFRLPETKDRTYEELDVLFSHKIPARGFKKAKVDAYGETVD
ncbi:uncharacterized protein LTR77_003914 [Saxophila tyrrhenica]|uniref:Major facilitator superfamily (MFS) profile domain-containing protein n=1 Tax=Saxophila tyrrhenica TaxID=1690608 RepID=A0AAV9PIE1_9PEZI|nr:hypothetical protein LTR77_003914 [Saxophila tyrrhenica]